MACDAVRRHNRSGEPDMSTVTPARYLRRDPRDVQPWAETCGQIRCLVEEHDAAAAEVHHVEIHDAKLHYHARTDEFYYIISGSGRMVLDDDEIEVHEGVVVYVPRGVRHKAVGDLTVLTICIPRGVLSDVHELE
jgi:mannose-6-phosphate isomerase-like protein (cupin superfamily)